MLISKLKIKNFRSFGEEETILNLNNLSALIGSNSSGKTAAMQALLKLFGINKKEREINRSDFHLPAHNHPSEIENASLQIEAILEFPELVSDKGTSTIAPHFEQMIVNGEGQIPYVRIRLIANWTRGNTPEGEVESKVYYVCVPEGSKEEDEDLIPVPLSDRVHIQMIYVPATRDPSTQLKNASGTLLWRIIRGINWPSDFQVEVEKQLEDLDQLFHGVNPIQKVREILGEQWKRYHNDRRYSHVELNFNGKDLDSILKKTDITFEPTEIEQRYNVEQLGDGLRSMFYLTLVGSLLELEDLAMSELSQGTEDLPFNFTPPSLTILAVEEPENHIAPHLLGRIVDNLKSIAQKNNSQVILSSHTPSIIKRIDPEAIIHLRIDNNAGKTIANAITLPEKGDMAYKYIKNAVQAYPELYFAKLVILGEGDSEEIILPKVIEQSGTTIDSSGISVVPLGGRHVNHLWKLLHQLAIPFITLLDLDRERDGGGWGRIKYVIEQLIENGQDENELLEVNSEIISLDELKGWDVEDAEDVETMDSWIKFLERYDIYFSYPLDLDFMMLSHFPDEYKATAPSNGGPRIPDRIKEETEYQKKRAKSIRATLKDQGGSGLTYTENELDLMIWYNYLFLTRGKPSTHIMALSEIDNLSDSKLPRPLKNLILAIERKLEGV